MDNAREKFIAVILPMLRQATKMGWGLQVTVGGCVDRALGQELEVYDKADVIRLEERVRELIELGYLERPCHQCADDPADDRYACRLIEECAFSGNVHWKPKQVDEEGKADIGKLNDALSEVWRLRSVLRAREDLVLCRLEAVLKEMGYS